MIRNIAMTALVCGLFVHPFRATADDAKKPDGPPDPMALMKAMMEAGKVGDMHKKLEPMAGSWDFSIKFWMDPSKPPDESKGTSESKWIMGGRYLQQEVKGNFGGMEFLGSGLVGYDNLKEKYVYAWVDNMGTAISYATGKFDKTGKVLTFDTEELNPLTKKPTKGRDVTILGDDGSYKSEFYKTEGGKEFKVMEITYTKKK